MGVQDLTVQMVVIVVIGVFFASFMDAIAGGGGIISVPTYLLAGLPMHFALGTNKFSSSIGTAFSTGRYIKNGYVDWKLGIPSIVLALIGSFFGTKLQLMISEVYLQYLLLIVLPVVAFVVLRQRQLPEERGDIEPKSRWPSSIWPRSSSARTTGSTGPARARSCCSFSAISASSTCARRAAMSSS